MEQSPAYTLADDETAPLTPAPLETQPYIPPSSFTYHLIEEPLKAKTTVKVISHENGIKEIIIETYFIETNQKIPVLSREKNNGDILIKSLRKTRRIVHI